MSAYDDMLSGFEDRQPPKESFGEKLLNTATKVVNNPAVSDISTTLGNYATGAYQGAKERVKENVKLFQMTNWDGTPKEGYTQEEVDAQKALTQKADTAFVNETELPAAATVAGILNPAVTYAGITANMAYEGYQKTGTVGGAVREATYGPLVDFASQDNLSQKFAERPVSTTVSGILGLGQAVAPGLMAFGGIRAARGRFEPASIEDMAQVDKNGVVKVTDDYINPAAKEMYADTERQSAPVESMRDVASTVENGPAYQDMMRGFEKETTSADNFTTSYVEQPREGEQGYLGGSNTIQPAISTYDKPVTRAEIVNDINNLVTSRTGSVGNKNYLGVYKEMPDIVRSRDYGDFDTYSHEIGHYIDQKLDIKGFDNELIAGADKEFSSNQTYQKYTPMQKRAEGVAEFGRQYLLNPAEAEKNFPGYYNDFVSKLAENKDVAKSLDTIGQKMRTWYSQAPEARGRGGVSFGNEDFTTFKQKATDAAYRAYEAFFDDKVALNRLTSEVEKQIGRELEFENNPYKKARMVQNSALARAEMLVTDDNSALVQDTLNKLYNNKLKYAVTMKDIFNGLNPKELNAKYPEYLKSGNFKNWHEAFSTYITARRQEELQRINPDYKGPIAKSDVQSIINNAPKELENIAEKFYQYNDNLLSIAEDGGLISKDTVAELRNKYKNYAPMSRDFSDEAALTDAYGTGKSLGNISNPLKRLTEEGSTRSVVDPLESVLKNTYTLIDAVERNKVSQIFVDLSSEKGIGKFIEEVPGTTSDANKSIFTVMVDGKKQAYQTTPEFYRAIMSMNRASSNMLINVLKPFAQVLRVGATISPDFIVRNLIRDTLTAGIYSETGFKPVLDTAKGVYSLIKDKELAYEFKASGAPLSSFVGLDRVTANRMLDKMAGSGWKNTKPVQIIEGLYQGARKASELAESSTRIREFERARQQGLSIEEAGLLAKDITLDFSRSGTITRKINQAIPFFNAVLQGGDRLVRAFKDNPLRTTQFVMTYIALPSIALWAINHEEDWYKELNDDIKNGSWLIKSGDTIIRIPKPFEPGILFGSAFERALDQAYEQDKEAMKQWTKYAVDGFRPSLMPTIAGPIIEWLTNYNFFTEKPIVGRKEQNLPDEMQYNAYTSEIAKSLGKMTRTSPMKIDNTINGYTASAGKFVVGLLDNLIGDKKEMPAKTVSELPGVRGLTYTPFKNPKSVEEFYDKFDKLEKEHNAYGKKGYVPNELKTMRKAEEQIRDLNKKNRDITLGNETPEKKRQLIDANSAKILEIAKKSLGK